MAIAPAVPRRPHTAMLAEAGTISVIAPASSTPRPFLLS
jgi:hypothetical protein